MERHDAQVLVGVDIGADTFAATVWHGPAARITQDGWANTAAAFPAFVAWLATHGGQPGHTVVCMEATGVYTAALAYTLHAQGFTVVIAHPLRVKKAFHPQRDKTDAVDSQQIAEYAYRFADELQPWQPPAPAVAQLQQWQRLRDQLLTQQGVVRNLQHVAARTVPALPPLHQQLAAWHAYLATALAQVEAAVTTLLQQTPALHAPLALVQSVPGIGPQLAREVCCVTAGFTQCRPARQLASYAGICPRRYESGRSVYRQPRCGPHGAVRLRRLLFLAALSQCGPTRSLHGYYQRKTAEGKAGRLVLNNMANKLVHRLCAVLRTQRPFDPAYRAMPLHRGGA